MGKQLVLDKTIKTNTEYQMPDRVSFIVTEIGTDVADDVVIKVDNKEVLTIKNLIAPITKSDTNILGPLKLGDYYIVIPEGALLNAVSSGSGYVRLRGYVYIHDPGERLPEPWLGRYYGQDKAMLKYYEGTFSLGTDVAWGKNSEQTILTIKPSAVEKVIVDGWLGVTISGGTWTYGNFALVLYYDGNPVEFLWQKGVGPGIDCKYLPRPPTISNWHIFTMEPIKFELEKEHKLEFKVRNVSGTDLTPDTGSSWTVTLTVLTKYHKG